jgi:hypothetical protein
MSRNRSPQSPPEREATASPELQEVLRDLQSPDDWRRASAVRALCPCRRKDWGVPVYRYVVAMQDDPSPIVRGAVHHDLTENRKWNENWEAALIQERRARRIRVTVGAKATALADLCEQLRIETGLPLSAEASVADDKVTIFCRQMPLRAVMRQLCRSLGYDWVWRKKDDAGHLELVRDPHAGSLQKADTPARRVRDHLLRSRVSLPLFAAPEGMGCDEAGSGVRQVKVTSADLLEALHQASGLPIIADYYTRLVAVDIVAFTQRPLRDLLDHVATTMRLRWRFSDGGGATGHPSGTPGERGGGSCWVLFRSIWGHFEQLQEVPDRHLTRWAEWRRQEGHLPIEALMEIAGLPYAQRASTEMAEGAREIWGLAEWSLAAVGLPEHLRFLAEFSPSQRERATSGPGLPFLEMSPPQQQRFLSLALGEKARPSQDALAEALLRVEYCPTAQRETEPTETRLEFIYRLGTPDAEANVAFVATGRGCEVRRYPSGRAGGRRLSAA